MTTEQTLKPFCFMTHESKFRLLDGGNCKGAVPVHGAPSKTAKIPLYTGEFLDRIAELERQLAEARKDQARLDTISNEYLQIEAFEIPTGSDDADIGWRIYQSYCGEENPRLIVEQYEDDLRQAIDAAIAQQKVKT